MIADVRTRDLSATVAARVSNEGFLHLSAEIVRDATESDEADWLALGSHWNDLEVDQYMADAGTYRRRRYRELVVDAGRDEITVHPPRPYHQPRMINPLNGGIERHFAPSTPEFLASPLLHNLLRVLGRAFTQATGVSRWNVRLHQNRISASVDQIGQPAPEGLHRDGVTFIMTLMVGRTNIEGGESSVHAADGSVLYQRTLAQSGELLIADDRRTLHSVTPIVPIGITGHRDVLVISFTDPIDE